MAKYVKIIAVKLTQEQYNKYTKYAKTKDTNISALVREQLDKLVSNKK